MKIVETNQQSIGNEMRSVYRIRIFPKGLAVEGTPSVLLADGRGRNSVLNGKPLIVRTISGDSTQIKEPLQPHFRKTKSFTYVGIASAIILLLLALLVFLRIQENDQPHHALNFCVSLEGLNKNYNRVKCGIRCCFQDYFDLI